MNEEDDKEIESYEIVEETKSYTKYIIKFADGTKREYTDIYAIKSAAREPQWKRKVKRIRSKEKGDSINQEKENQDD